MLVRSTHAIRMDLYNDYQNIYQVGPLLKGNDHFLGSNYVDWLEGWGGNDLMHGNGGNDYLWGDDGNDTLFGDAGNDRLDGGAGNDILGGGIGNDRIDGSAGNDRIVGDAGNDYLIGSWGNDTLTGGAGNDVFNIILPGYGYGVYREGRDNITDFNPAQDTFHFGIGSQTRIDGHNVNYGRLPADQFEVNTTGQITRDIGVDPDGAVHNQNVHFIYNKATGWISYDRDGLHEDVMGNSMATELLVHVAPGLNLTASDFVIV